MTPQLKEVWKESVEEFAAFNPIQSADSDPDSFITLAKYSPIQFPLNMEGSVIDVEIWTVGDDRIEIL